MAYPDNVMKAVLRWIYPGGSTGFNVFHHFMPGGADADPAFASAIGLYWADFYNNANFASQTNVQLRSFISDSCTLVDVVVSSLDAGPSVQWTTPVNLAGSVGGGDPLPNETCIVTTFYGPTPGRKARGRVFWGGWDSSALDPTNGRVRPSSLTALQNTMTKMIAGWDELNFDLCVNSYTYGEANVITSALVRNTFHHQRRRNQ